MAVPAPRPWPPAHPSRRWFEHDTDSLLASPSKSKVPHCSLNATVYPWLGLTWIGKGGCPASPSLSCPTIWPLAWHGVVLPRVSLAEDGGTALPRCFLDRDRVARVETQEGSGRRNRKWSGGSRRMDGGWCHFCPMKFSGAVFQARRAGYGPSHFHLWSWLSGECPPLRVL